MYLTACHLQLFYSSLNIKVHMQKCPFVKLVMCPIEDKVLEHLAVWTDSYRSLIFPQTWMSPGPSLEGLLCPQQSCTCVAELPCLGRLKAHPSSCLNKKGKVQFYQSSSWGTNEFTGHILEQWIRGCVRSRGDLKVAILGDLHITVMKMTPSCADRVPSHNPSPPLPCSPVGLMLPNASTPLTP